jgi:hypothetical protein
MHKALALAAALLAGCSSGPELHPSVASLPSPEADGKAPGMIPVECESLLQKSQEWGYVPGRAWRPADREQALDALQFFAGFRLATTSTSDFYRAFLASDIPEAGATDAVEKLAQAQVCDSMLAHQFLESLVAYPWGARDRKEAGDRIYQFVLNQQVLSLPLGPRLVPLDIYQKAMARGLLRGQLAAVRRLQAEADRRAKGFSALGDQPAEEQVSRMKQELLLAEELRDQLSRMLPLP